MVAIDVTLGELLDRLSILSLKLPRGAPPGVAAEHAALAALPQTVPGYRPAMLEGLLDINRVLWDLEDRMAGERDDHQTAATGRAIAAANRERSSRKRLVNEAVGHAVEFKTYGSGSGGRG